MNLAAAQPGGFTGQFRLSDPVGIFWADYTQSGALVLSAANDGIVGCGDRVKIIADGNTITFSDNYTWINVGTDSIDTTATAVNIVLVWKVSATELNYVVKIIA